jgi:PPOX class probable F420-dependent enzyme
MEDLRLMALDITPAIETRLKNDYVIWLTTVRADGMPQPTPVWFIWQDDSILIYSSDKAQKIRNIRANGKVAVNLDNTHDGENYVVFQGEAKIEPDALKASQMPAYIEKYRQGMADINMTPEIFDENLPVAIRFTPLHVRGE